MATRTSQVSLINYFVFNSTYGPKEGEEEKRVLYYYPPDVAIDTKIRQIGLCEGIIKLTSTFSDSAVDSVHTQKTRQLFYQPEKDFWTVLTVNVPCLEKVVDGRLMVDYLEEEVQDEVYQAILIQVYQAFRLFNGTMTYILSKTDKNGLMQRLEHFFNRYLPALQLARVGVLEMFNGIQYLPLDKHSYARIQSFLNQLKAALPQIYYTILLHNEQQIWSDLDQEDTRIMYNYLSTSLFPAVAAQESRPAVESRPVSASNGESSQQAAAGRFVHGPPNLADESNMGPIPKVHLSDCGESVECFLVVYRLGRTTLCLLVRGDFQITFDFLRNINKFCSTQLAATAADIAEHCPKKSSSFSPESQQHKYVYVNRMNMAEKSSICAQGQRTLTASSTIVADTVLRMIGNIYTDFTSMPELDDGEIIAKMSNDCWIVGKKCDQREAYIIVNQKNGSLAEINEEVKRVCQANFSNIFFQD